MNFVAVDVETANADMSTICQIGIATYRKATLADEWKTYVDPEDYFDGINVSIHGIDEDVVQGAPTFAELASQIYDRLRDEIVVSHTHFDRVALHQAAARYALPPIPGRWLDSARVARRSWKEVANRGYGLQNLCERINYQYAPHDALEDAKASANVFIACCAQTGREVEEWFKWVKRPIDPSGGSIAFQREGNPEGPLYGEVVVFTGALEIPRREAADLAATVGIRVATGVSKKITMLVVGDQDVRRLAGHEKSSKHRKAEELIAKGAEIRILRETDFRELVNLSD